MDLLSASEVLDQWTRHAYRRAVALRLPVDFLEEGRDIVVHALGRAWLQDAIMKSPKGYGLRRRGHPIASDFIIAGDPQIVEIIEIAVYIKRLVGTPGLEETLGNLRGQFDSSLLQMAYAYRFRQAGAAVVLEPASARGRKADIGIEIDSAAFLAECYVPRFGGKGTGYIGPTEFTPQKIADMATYFKIKARVRLVFRREPGQEEQSQLEAAARDAIIEACRVGHAVRDNEFVQVFVKDISNSVTDPDWPDPAEDAPISVPTEADFIVSEFVTDRSDVDNVRDGLRVTKQRGTRILYKWPPREEPSEVERVNDLTERFEDKLSQAKLEGRRRLLIAQVREGRSPKEQDTRVAQAVGDRLFRIKDDLAGIVLASRAWTPDNRFRYGTIMLHGRPENRMPARIGEAFRGIDVRGDLLGDWR